MGGGFARSKGSPNSGPSPTRKSTESPATTASKDGVSWSKTYRWRLEGNLLDRRDFVEGWDRPDYDDSAWAQQPFGQEPPIAEAAGAANAGPESAGRGGLGTGEADVGQPPGLAPMAGAIRGCRSSSRCWMASRCGRRWNCRTLSAGEHLVALRVWPLQTAGNAANYDPWGQRSAELQWPNITAEPGSAAETDRSRKGKSGTRPTCSLPADSRWNAIQIDQPLRGRALRQRQTDLPAAAAVCSRAAWRAGDNLLVWGNLDSSEDPFHAARADAHAAGGGHRAGRRAACRGVVSSR